MKDTIFKLDNLKTLSSLISRVYGYNINKRHYSNAVKYTLRKDTQLHPYRKIHPWNSLDNFSKYLCDNIIYNEKGLVVLNKPFGISAKRKNIKTVGNEKIYTRVINEVDYTISDALPYIAEKLGYSELNVVKTPEKFTSGILLLAANEDVENAVNKSCMHAVGAGKLNKAYWIITTNTPVTVKGKQHLCMTKKLSPNGKSSCVEIVSKWSNRNVKRRIAKILNVEFEVISNSTYNLSSLIEIKSSTAKWHALRLFASTILYSPILGDNIYGTRIHQVAGTYVLANPFSEVDGLPKLNPQLLEILHLTQAKQELIPVHIHLRRFHLPAFLPQKQELILEAPVLSYFKWTCMKLKFKHIPELQENSVDEDEPLMIQ